MVGSRRTASDRAMASARAGFPETDGASVWWILVDSRFPEHRLVRQAVLSVLQHWGVPYRTVDLAWEDLVDIEQEGAFGVLVAQEGVAARLSSRQISAVGEVVVGGGGLVSLDSRLRGCSDAWWELVDLHEAEPAIPCSVVRVRDTDHPITRRRIPEEDVRLRAPVFLQGATPGSGARVLLDTGHPSELGAWATERPAMVAVSPGRGRVVQFLTPFDVWDRRHLGHGAGLTDLLWRSVAWSARRPFLVQAMPPFVTTRIDNVTGNRDSFAYVDVLNRHGHVAVLGLYTRRVRKEHAVELHRRQQRGLVECGAHALDDDARHLVYGTLDGTDRSAEEFEVVFGEVDETFERWRVQQARVVNAQWGIINPEAVPSMLDRGQLFTMKPLRLGQAMVDDLEDANRGWRPRPFGNHNLVMDYLPEAPLYAASVQLPRREGMDFLQGCATCGTGDVLGAGSIDVMAAARKGARMIRFGLENGFFGCLLTHEERVYAISLDQFDAVLGEIDRMLGGWPRVSTGYDHVAEYAKSRDESYISELALDEKGRCRIVLRGSSTVVQHLQVFEGDEIDPFEIGFIEVPPFQDRLETSIALSEARGLAGLRSGVGLEVSAP